MKKLLELMSEQFEKAFSDCGYDKKYAKVTVSNRPDLCEYQCNGAMAAAKEYKKAPFIIAEEITAKLAGNDMFEMVEMVKPGFINIVISQSFLAAYAEEMINTEKLGFAHSENPKTIVIDYGGANVAKPLHVGHLRPAIIGESIKRIRRFVGDTVIGDVHLGDWGLQMGLIIEQLHSEQPELPYFDESYIGDFPSEPPFTIDDLEKIYPAASARAKEDAAFKERAHTATLKLQEGYAPYRALWKHILNVSVIDLKKNYEKLNVSFDLWKGESDAEVYIPDMIHNFIESGFAHESQGALIIDVEEENDTKTIPPCIIKKSDGASLYATSDLATIIQRTQDYHPDEIIYITDNRQEMHFTQIFRVARKAGLCPDTKLIFLGNGTMNGKDGRPFKTREGGVMRLEELIASICAAVYDKIMDNRTVSDDEAKKVSEIVGLAALKYGDLSNQASKDYMFDIERFASFEGNTGPYILYTIVRIKSILEKYEAAGNDLNGKDEHINTVQTDAEKALIMEAVRFNSMIEAAYSELAPHRVCAYVYDLSNEFNKFYHETSIMGETDKKRQAGFISLLKLIKRILETSIDLLGLSAPERM
jgi:arginyl-tRNA synthetase